MKLTETSEYKYKKDESITIKKQTYVKEKNKLLHKYTAEKNSIFAKGFPSEEDAVKELNRKLNLVNNQKKQNQMSNLSELKKQLELAESQVKHPFIADDRQLLASAKIKIAELKEQIKNFDSEAEETNLSETSEIESDVVSEGETLEELYEQKEIIESQINESYVKNNPVRLAATQRELKEIEDKISKMGDKVKTKKEVVTQKQPKEKVKVKESIQKEKKQPKVEQPKEPKQKSVETKGVRIKVGDMVNFEERESGKIIKGEVVKLEPTSAGDSFNAYVLMKSGEKKKVRAHKLKKI